VYATKGGRVRAVGVASASLGKHPTALRKAVARLLAARASQVKPVFKPSATASASRLTGTVLAGATDPRLNSAFAYLCGLQM
jgi:hypothetical protein